MDLAGSVAAAILFGPAALGIASVLKIVSPGPLLFRQERIGRDGRPFVCLKFRTMVNGAGCAAHREHFAHLVQSGRPMAKLDDDGDARLVPGGAMLRACGLDELPQIVNVLRGEMSLVGPRPCLPYEYELYQGGQRERFAVVPGITGLWQVSGKNTTTFDEMVRIDIEYARHFSIWLDLKILLLTIPAVAAQVRAMRRMKGEGQERGRVDGRMRSGVPGPDVARSTTRNVS